MKFDASFRSIGRRLKQLGDSCSWAGCGLRKLFKSLKMLLLKLADARTALVTSVILLRAVITLSDGIGVNVDPEWGCAIWKQVVGT